MNVLLLALLSACDGLDDKDPGDDTGTPDSGDSGTPPPVEPAHVGGTSGIMIGSFIQSLFGTANNMPLGAAVSIFMMLVVTGIVCLFLWGVGYRKMKARGA